MAQTKYAVLADQKSKLYKIAQVEHFGDFCLLTIGKPPSKEVSFLDIAMEDFNDLLTVYNQKIILSQIVPSTVIDNMLEHGDWTLIYAKGETIKDAK